MGLTKEIKNLMKSIKELKKKNKTKKVAKKSKRAKKLIIGPPVPGLMSSYANAMMNNSGGNSLAAHIANDNKNKINDMEAETKRNEKENNEKKHQKLSDDYHRLNSEVGINKQRLTGLEQYAMMLQQQKQVQPRGYVEEEMEPEDARDIKRIEFIQNDLKEQLKTAKPEEINDIVAEQTKLAQEKVQRRAEITRKSNITRAANVAKIAADNKKIVEQRDSEIALKTQHKIAALAKRQAEAEDMQLETKKKAYEVELLRQQVYQQQLQADLMQQVPATASSSSDEPVEAVEHIGRKKGARNKNKNV